MNNNKSYTLGCWVNSTNDKLLTKIYKKKLTSKDVLEILLEGYLTENITTKFQELFIYELKKIGNNMNQIARAANSNPHLITPDVEKQIKNTLNSLEEGIKKLIENQYHIK